MANKESHFHASHVIEYALKIDFNDLYLLNLKGHNNFLYFIWKH